MARPTHLTPVAERPQAEAELANGHTPLPPLIEDPPDVPTLATIPPGAAVPEAGDADVPYEASFNGKDWMLAPGLEAIGEALINSRPGLAHIRGVHIVYLWRRRGGQQQGKQRQGGCEILGGMKDFAWELARGSRVRFIITIAADHARNEAGEAISRSELERRVYHQLLHTDVDPEDNDAFRVKGHDFEGFNLEVTEYAAPPELATVAAHIRQMGLPQ